MKASLKKPPLPQEFSLLFALISKKETRSANTITVYLLLGPQKQRTYACTQCQHYTRSISKSSAWVFFPQSMRGLIFFLWEFEAKRLSKYAHASPRREVAQWVVQLRYRNRTPKCRRRARIRLFNPRNSRTPQLCCLGLCKGFAAHLTTAQPTAFSTVLQEPAWLHSSGMLTQRKKKIIFKQRIWTRNAAHESLRQGLEDSWWHILGDVTSDLGQGDPRAPVPRPRSCGWIGNRWWVVVGPKHPPLQASSVPSGPASSAQRKQLKNLVCHKAA